METQYRVRRRKGKRNHDQDSPEDHVVSEDQTAFDSRIVQRAVDDPSHLTPNLAVMLSRRFGNQYVSQLIQRSRNSVLSNTIQRSNPNEDPELIAFATAFNKEFKSVLHVFKSHKSSLDAVQQYAYEGQFEVSPAQLEYLFTSNQREKILRFINSRTIPSRLFNGDDIGKTVASQRILLSAHILAEGKYEPGKFEEENDVQLPGSPPEMSYKQGVHAKYCGHWAQLVWHYAGVTPANYHATGVQGNFDHFGNIVIGSWDTEYTQSMGKFYKGPTPNQETPAQDDGSGGTGPVPTHSNHYKSQVARDKLIEQQQETNANLPEGAEPIKVSRPITRRIGFSKSQIETIQPGDWLWYYNANASGSHSVIFSDWDGPWMTITNGAKSEDLWIHYRKIKVFSQGTPQGGGKEHSAYVGNAYYYQPDSEIIDEGGKKKTISGITVYPVTYIAHVDEDANPAQTVAELFPAEESKLMQRAGTANTSLIKAIVGKQPDPEHVSEFVIDEIMKTLRNENTNHILAIQRHLTVNQATLLHNANKIDDLESLVILTQRLRQLAHNTSLYEKNTEAHLAPKKAQVAEFNENINPQIQALNLEIAQIHIQAGLLEERISELNALIEEIDPAKARQELRSIQKDMKSALKLLEIERDFLITQPEDPSKDLRLAEIAKRIVPLKNDLKKIRDEIISNYKSKDPEKLTKLAEYRDERKLKKKDLNPLTWEIKKKQKEVAKLYKEAPWAYAHGGNNKSQMKDKVNGKLATIYTWEELKKIPALKDYPGLFARKPISKKKSTS